MTPDKRIIEYAESQGFIAVFPNGLPLPTAPVGSHNYSWGDSVNVNFMNRLINLMTNNFTIEWNFMGAIWDFFEHASTR